MLDIKYIRENLDYVKKSTDSKKCNVDFDLIISLDANRRELINDVEKLKAQRNLLNGSISKLLKNKQNASKLIDEMKKLSLQAQLNYACLKSNHYDYWPF